MSLNWNITNCKNAEAIKTDNEWYKTEHMIFATMAVDMHEITESNVIEFYARLSLIGKISEGSWWTPNVGWEYVTFEDVQKRIGLDTNAYSRNTFNQWLSRMLKVHSKYSKDQMLAIYYAAKVEAAEIVEKEMAVA